MTKEGRNLVLVWAASVVFAILAASAKVFTSDEYEQTVMQGVWGSASLVCFLVGISIYIKE